MKKLISLILAVVLVTALAFSITAPAFAAGDSVPQDDSATAVTDGADGTATKPNSLTSALPTILMIVAFVAVMYFVTIRPQRKEKKKFADMMDTLSVGDSVQTIGGIVGKVVSITENTVTFETGEDRVRMEVTKRAIASSGKPTSADATK
ncbi:MAG: preprotein translocase subunit YajC [Oscillospiraceae bacterium]|nr:preprotein translocase subunit YajC [Oscillospiraceae bacterium]